MPRPTTRPRLEVLEARWCPSCTVLQDRDTLFITGDRGDNRVDIVQVNDLTLRVTCDGGRASIYREVERVVVDTLGGNDEVRYLVDSPDALPPDMRVHLGAGDDQFLLRGDPEPVAGGRRAAVKVLGAAGDDRVQMIMPCVRSPLEFSADLGDGDDTFTGELGDVDLPASGEGLDLGNRVGIIIIGGRGGDTFDTTVGNPEDRVGPSVLNGDVSIDFVGDAGSDRAIIVQNNLVVNATLEATLDLGDGGDVGSIIINFVAAPEGVVAVSADGGPGADVMIADVNDFTGTLVSSVHGGPGDDVMIADANEFTGTLAWMMDGEQGRDSIFARVGFNPQPDPPGTPPVFRSATFQVTGGAADDVIDARLDLGNQPGSRVEAAVQGGAGDDQLGLALAGVTDPEELTALLDGGAGFDLARVSPGVRAVRCERVL